jgi:hypothetical protein
MKFRKLVEFFLPDKKAVSPLKSVPKNHPKAEYCYTLVGGNNKVIPASSLLQLGFIGQVRDATNFIKLDDQLLFKNLETVLAIARLYNIYKIRKYRKDGDGIEWESQSMDVYKKLLDFKLFGNIEED